MLFLFCGIGNPDSLIRDLEQQGHRIVNKIIFTDHHKFTVADEKCILDEFLKTGDSLLVCTAKDYVKLTSDELKKRAKVLTHSIEIEHKGELLAQIRHSL